MAEEIGVSLRTLYRDIASLQAQGATIEGEPGVGYLLRPGFLLPPLMFPVEEIEALVLGSRWVAERADDRLREAARSALARIAAVLPSELRDDLDSAALLIGPGATILADGVDPALLRKAIRTERKLSLAYRDGTGKVSERIVWPFALAFLRCRARAARMVRVAAGLPPFPHRSDRFGRADRDALCQTTAGPAPRVARGGRDCERTGLTLHAAGN